MPEQTPEARIRDLERRLDLDPGSRLFVSLAEEYRKVGRIKDALSALQKGLLAHPGYVAAQVALGRVYVEAKLTTDAIATFTKVLQADPGNLVAARSLADIYHDRGD
ncbi:MAG TPA: tetratricopeptide repeat protein, partial [Thermoanaerobaculia bacterium]|nr:tetratricopeptide repeat protein [Thermoanaerobaculia bacterium]